MSSNHVANRQFAALRAFQSERAMSNVEFAASRAARVVELRREARQEKRRNAHESRIATLAGAVCALDSLIGETSADLAILDQRDIATFRDSIAQLRDLLASETRVSYR